MLYYLIDLRPASKPIYRTLLCGVVKLKENASVLLGVYLLELFII